MTTGEAVSLDSLARVCGRGVLCGDAIGDGSEFGEHLDELTSEGTRVVDATLRLCPLQLRFEFDRLQLEAHRLIAWISVWFCHLPALPGCARGQSA